jgi:hypothetical protein
LKPVLAVVERHERAAGFIPAVLRRDEDGGPEARRSPLGEADPSLRRRGQAEDVDGAVGIGGYGVSTVRGERRHPADPRSVVLPMLSGPPWLPLQDQTPASREDGPAVGGERHGVSGAPMPVDGPARPAGTSHSRTVLSWLAVTRVLPSPANAREVTGPEWPVRVRLTFPAVPSHNLTAPSRVPRASAFPPGAKARQATSPTSAA